MEIAANGEMRALLADPHAARPVRRLARGDRRTIAAGFEVRDGRVYLRHYLKRLQTAPVDDAYGDERWVNDIHLESRLPETDPLWRIDVIEQGLGIITALLPAMAAIAPGQTVCAELSLQSGPESIDPEIDFAMGNMRFTVLREEILDQRADLDRYGQPVLVASLRGESV